MNYLLTLRFDGGRYHGWQRQENAVTVQQRVEEAVFGLFGERTHVIGCSRTDAGVHAERFMANFTVCKTLPPQTVVSGMNFYLPQDVAVLSCLPVPEDFHAQYCCVSKEYRYVLYDTNVRDPFLNGRACHCKHRLNEALMDRNAKDYIGTHDFTSFCAAGASVRSNVRTVINAGVKREGDRVYFYVEADGFLYNMVRIMAGTLLYIDEGKLPDGGIPAIIQAKNRLRAGKTMPPEGLYLYRVHYSGVEEE